jgi:hypothetical protein
MTDSIGDDRLSDADLFEVIRTDAWPATPRRDPLVTAEKQEAAARKVGSMATPFGAWQSLRDLRTDTGPATHERLFHLRHRKRSAAVRVALCPCADVPKARCLPHPVSVIDAIEFTLVDPLVRDIERKAHRAAVALDAIGQPTWGQNYQWSPPPARKIVWRTRSADERMPFHRATALLTAKLLEKNSDGKWWAARFVERGVLPEGHNAQWGHIQFVAIGALAWRAAAAEGLRVLPTREYPGARFFVRQEAVGRAFADLESPFELLLDLAALGVGMVAHSSEAILLELRI